MNTPLNPLNPLMHAAYGPALDWSPGTGKDPLPSDVRKRVSALLDERNTAPESRIERIDSELVDATFWYVLRPDEIAAQTIERHGFREPLTIQQATVVLVAIGESGFPITGNGAPDYDRDRWDDPDPVRGADRDRVIWAAAAYWAEFASRHITYVSLGDYRGFMSRAVQFDQPGRMNPSQQAAVTFGPAADAGDECDSHGYMRRHTRRLVLVRP